MLKIDLKNGKEDAKTDTWIKEKREVMCDQCMFINEVPSSKGEEDVKVICEWCSHTFIVSSKQ